MQAAFAVRGERTDMQRKPSQSLLMQAAVALAGGLLIAGAVHLWLRPEYDHHADETVESRFYPLRSVWSSSANLGSNVSLFVFRDANRNGVFDIGDRPMHNIAVIVRRPDSSTVVRRSNVHGFVNISNVLGDYRADVHTEGEYGWEAIIPKDLELISAHRQGTIRYRSDSTSRPGIIADTIPTPLAIAPRLSISGRVHIDHLSQDSAFYEKVSLVVRRSSMPDSVIALRRDGSFSLPAEPGIWQLQVRAPGYMPAMSTVTVGAVPVVLGAIRLPDSTGEPLPVARTVDFEAAHGVPITKVPNGVGCINWVNVVAVDGDFYDGPGYTNATMSGRKVAYNSSGYGAELLSSRAFDFVGGFFGVAWPQAEGESLEVTGWRDGQAIRRDVLVLSAYRPLWFEAEYRRVDRVTFRTGHYWQFVMDDVSLRTQHVGKDSNGAGGGSSNCDDK